MPTSRTKSSGRNPVIQFSIFTENKVGSMSELVNLLGTHNVHIMALNTLDSTDSAILRLVVDDPERARELFHDHGFPFTLTHLLVVEILTEVDLGRVLAALLEAEINIHYLYSFIFRPRERAAIALNVEDMELAIHAVEQRGFHTLDQGDVSR